MAGLGGLLSSQAVGGGPMPQFAANSDLGDISTGQSYQQNPSIESPLANMDGTVTTAGRALTMVHHGSLMGAGASNIGSTLFKNPGM